MIAKASTVRALRAELADLELQVLELRAQLAAERAQASDERVKLMQAHADERSGWAERAAEERSGLIDAIVTAAQRPELSPTPPWDGSRPRLHRTEDDEIVEARAAAAELIEAELAAREAHGLDTPVPAVPSVERRAEQAPV